MKYQEKNLMKNEFVVNDITNTAISKIYQAMYSYTDRGIKNGELTTKIKHDGDISLLIKEITEYFDSIYLNAKLKKYFIVIQAEGDILNVEFKWGYHAIVANGQNTPN